jgi:hypothetical protein
MRLTRASDEELRYCIILVSGRDFQLFFRRINQGDHFRQNPNVV